MPRCGRSAMARGSAAAGRAPDRGEDERQNLVPLILDAVSRWRRWGSSRTRCGTCSGAPGQVVLELRPPAARGVAGPALPRHRSLSDFRSRRGLSGHSEAAPARHSRQRRYRPPRRVRHSLRPRHPGERLQASRSAGKRGDGPASDRAAPATRWPREPTITRWASRSAFPASTRSVTGGMSASFAGRPDRRARRGAVPPRPGTHDAPARERFRLYCLLEPVERHLQLPDPVQQNGQHVVHVRGDDPSSWASATTSRKSFSAAFAFLSLRAPSGASPGGAPALFSHHVGPRARLPTGGVTARADVPRTGRRTRPHGGRPGTDHGETADPDPACAELGAREHRPARRGTSPAATDGRRRLTSSLCSVPRRLQLGRRIIGGLLSSAGQLRGRRAAARVDARVRGSLSNDCGRPGTARHCAKVPPRGEPERSMGAPLTGGDGTRVRFAWLPRPGTLGYHRCSPRWRS